MKKKILEYLGKSYCCIRNSSLLDFLLLYSELQSMHRIKQNQPMASEKNMRPYFSSLIVLNCMVYPDPKFLIFSFCFHVKFRFSKKATNFETISHLICCLLSKCQIKWKITPNFLGLLRKVELYSAGKLRTIHN